MSVVNPTAESQPIEFKFTNAFFQLVNRRVIAGKTPNDFNQPGKEPVVSIRTLAPSKRTGGNLFVQPFSITLFEFDAKQ